MRAQALEVGELMTVTVMMTMVRNCYFVVDLYNVWVCQYPFLFVLHTKEFEKAVTWPGEVSRVL